ncbi:MAG TPA: hypothetical protein VGI31_09480 [Streptosporangiaceae bacterium]|jgi:hypothetical protein
MTVDVNLVFFGVRFASRQFGLGQAGPAGGRGVPGSAARPMETVIALAMRNAARLINQRAQHGI